jgi:hypothetical protein
MRTRAPRSHSPEGGCARTAGRGAAQRGERGRAIGRDAPHAAGAAATEPLLEPDRPGSQLRTPVGRSAFKQTMMRRAARPSVKQDGRVLDSLETYAHVTQQAVIVRLSFACLVSKWTVSPAAPPTHDRQHHGATPHGRRRCWPGCAVWRQPSGRRCMRRCRAWAATAPPPAPPEQRQPFVCAGTDASAVLGHILQARRTPQAGASRPSERAQHCWSAVGS